MQIVEFSILVEIFEGLKKLWFESMYLKLSNGKSRFSIICLRKKGHVCSQKPLWRTPERGFDMRISINIEFLHRFDEDGIVTGDRQSENVGPSLGDPQNRGSP